MLLCGRTAWEAQSRMKTLEVWGYTGSLGTRLCLLSRTPGGGERVQAQDEENLYKTSNFRKVCWIPGSGDFSVLTSGTWTHT